LNHREQTFEALVRDNRDSIYRICRAYVYNKLWADDLYQEILLQLWGSMDNYRGAAKLSTWVYRVAVNTAITYNTRQKKHAYHPLPDISGLPADHPPAEDEQLHALYRAINQLEPQDRLVISLVLEGLSYKEIAEITGATVSNTGARISRIKTRIMNLTNPENKAR
jgi:RNA polymerase sigma-70 factor (ECF subfamily)